MKTNFSSPGPQPDATVADDEGEGIVVGAKAKQNRLPLTVVDGIGQEISQDAFDAARIDICHDGLVGHVHDQFGAGFAGEMANCGNGRSRTHTHVELFGCEFRDTGVVAGDFEEVRQKPLEPVQLGDKQFRRPTQHRVEVLAAVVDQVGGHADRGQRCAEFMADIGGEAFLETAELLQLGDLFGQTLGHLVEGHGQARHVVPRRGPAFVP